MKDFYRKKKLNERQKSNYRKRGKAKALLLNARGLKSGMSVSSNTFIRFLQLKKNENTLETEKTSTI